VIRLMAVLEEEGKAPRALTYESSAPYITIGRDSKSDFQIPSTTISRQHCRISLVDDTYLVTDLQSTHGTSLNGKKINPGEKKVLNDGDIIELAKARVTCSMEDEKLILADSSEKTQAVAA